MSQPSSLIDRVLKLSAFDGDSRAALQSLHAHFAVDFPDCSLALLLVRDQVRGRARLAGLIGPDGVEQVANDDPNGSRNTLPPFDDAVAAHIVDSAQPHAFLLPLAERALPLAQVMFAPHAVLAIPVVNAGQTTHWLAFGSSAASAFDGIDLDHSLLHVNLATSLMVRPLSLRALTRETERQRNEIESLADIQRLLLPDNQIIRGLEHAAYWQPAETAAGDYYEMSNLSDVAPEEFVRGGDDSWGVIVADVSGHGAAAAMEAVQFDAILRTYRGDGETPPAGAITYANKYFFSRRNRGHFMSVFALLYRPDTKILGYLSAGHPPILLKRGSNVQLLGEGDQIPLGVLRDYEFHNNEIALENGDMLVLYTDGVTEARNANDEMFGIERLRALVETGDTSPQPLLDSIVAAVRAHQNNAFGSDDQTLIVLKIAATQ